MFEATLVLCWNENEDYKYTCMKLTSAKTSILQFKLIIRESRIVMQSYAKVPSSKHTDFKGH